MATKEEQSKIGKSNVRSSKVHERRVKDLLTEWSGRPFRRRRVEGRGDDVRVVEGVADVIPVEGEIYFAIEAKKERNFSLNALLASPHTALFSEWWHQASYDAHLLGQKATRKCWPLLFFKPVPSWDWIAIAQEAFSVLQPKAGLERYGDVWFSHLRYDGYARSGPITCNVSRSKKHPVMVPLDLPVCYFCRWQDFAANVDPASFFLPAVPAATIL
jgi:hypothetical protein